MTPGPDGHVHQGFEEIQAPMPVYQADDDSDPAAEVIQLYRSWYENEENSIVAGRESEDFYCGRQWGDEERANLKISHALASRLTASRRTSTLSPGTSGSSGPRSATFRRKAATRRRRTSITSSRNSSSIRAAFGPRRASRLRTASLQAAAAGMSELASTTTWPASRSLSAFLGIRLFSLRTSSATQATPKAS
jgi:hypothetical protein